MDHDSDKAGAMGADEGRIGVVESKGSTTIDTEFTEEEQKHIIRRLDRRLITTVGIMYCVSLMDRTNLGAANIAGMDVELDMNGPVNGIRYVSGQHEQKTMARNGN